jgi:tRNA U34 5-carboxymethylaminomethyl modifying GTPase MnmE/TrmE
MPDTFTTRAEHDRAEAISFAEAVHSLAEAMHEEAYKLTIWAARGDFTIPLGTDCKAFEARIATLTAEIEALMDGYRPGERGAAQ